MKHLFRSFAAILISFLLSPLSFAAGPLDAEAGVLWWVHDVDATDVGKSNADAAGAYAEVWWANNWGISGDYYESDPGGGLSSATAVSIDVKRRLLSPTENNYIALGMGWEDAELVTGGNAQGPRFVAEGRFGIGIMFLYAQGAIMPDLGDAGARRNLDATEYEAGLSFTPFPFLNFRAGYRSFELDFSGGSQTSEGYFLGAALHF
jgi:hypothetical protein